MASKIDKVLTQLAVMDERDQNTAKDIETIQKTLQVVVERGNKHELSLYGESGKNGLVGNNKILMRAFYGANAIVGLIFGAVALFREQIGSFFMGDK